MKLSENIFFGVLLSFMGISFLLYWLLTGEFLGNTNSLHITVYWFLGRIFIQLENINYKEKLQNERK